MSSVETIRGRQTRVDQFDGESSAVIARAEAALALIGLERVYETITEMKADTALLEGDLARTLGYYAAHDGGGAAYQIVTVAALGDTPDGYGDHALANGLAAELIHDNKVVGEWWGAGSGGEISARLQAAWDSMLAWQEAQGELLPCSFAFSSVGTVKNQVRFCNPDGSMADNVDVNISLSKLTAVSGGDLSSTKAVLYCRIKSGMQIFGEVDGGKFAACYDFNGMSSSQSHNPVARHYKGKGIRVRGAVGSWKLYNPVCTEYSQTDVEFNTQANFTATAFSVEDGDFTVINANILFSKIGVYFDAVAVQVHFVNAHIVGGNPNHDDDIVPFTDMILVENHATRENHLDNCYFDNGIVKDYQQTLYVNGGHWVDNGAAILTEPKFKLIANTPNQIANNIVTINNLAGKASVGLVDDGLNTWAGDTSGFAALYEDMSAENATVSVAKTRYNLWPSNADINMVHIKSGGEYRERYFSGVDVVEVEIAPTTGEVLFDAATVRVNKSGSDKAFYVGGGDNGISETGGAGGALNIHSGGAKRWKSDNSGDFLPAADGTQSLGGSALRLLKGWMRSIGIGQSTVTISTGSGSPEGAVTATKGAIYLRDDGGAGSSFYVKESGTGNTGWAAK